MGDRTWSQSMCVWFIFPTVSRANHRNIVVDKVHQDPHLSIDALMNAFSSLRQPQAAASLPDSTGPWILCQNEPWRLTSSTCDYLIHLEHLTLQLKLLSLHIQRPFLQAELLETNLSQSSLPSRVGVRCTVGRWTLRDMGQRTWRGLANLNDRNITTGIKLGFIPLLFLDRSGGLLLMRVDAAR